MKFATGQGDDYTTGCSLDHPLFGKYYKLITIYLSKQQAINDDLKPIQKINFTGHLNRTEGAAMFFIVKEAKETVQVF